MMQSNQPPKPKVHKVKVEQVTGSQLKVTLDGEEVKNASGVSVEMREGKLPIVSISFPAEIEMELPATEEAPKDLSGATDPLWDTFPPMVPINPSPWQWNPNQIGTDPGYIYTTHTNTGNAGGLVSEHSNAFYHNQMSLFEEEWEKQGLPAKKIKYREGKQPQSGIVPAFPFHTSEGTPKVNPVTWSPPESVDDIKSHYSISADGTLNYNNIRPKGEAIKKAESAQDEVMSVGNWKPVNPSKPRMPAPVYRMGDPSPRTFRRRDRIQDSTPDDIAKWSKDSLENIKGFGKKKKRLF
jgi:hypothetical protein